LEPLIVLGNRKKSTVTKLNRNSKLFKAIIKAVTDKKAENVVSLDLRQIPEAVADFFVICNAASTTQVKAIADNVEHEVKLATGENPYHNEGFNALQWVIIDYVSVVVHIMHKDARAHYRLEDMWSDAPAQGHDI
jgi:ribosome-associated protein